MLYMINGACAMITGPLIGRLSDKLGKFRTFVAGTVLSIVMIVWYTGLVEASFTLIVVLNVLLFMGISGRMVSSFALSSALPDMKDRGAYMAINSSLQQLSGGAAAWLAGMIVVQATPSARLEHYDTLGYVASAAAVITLVLMYNVHRLVAAGPKDDAVRAANASPGDAA